MGITHDQIAHGQLDRLRYHLSQLVYLGSPRGSETYRSMRSRAEFDAHAWAFAAILGQGDFVAMIRIAAQCVRDGIGFSDEHSRECRRENEYDPRWGLDVIEILVRAYSLLSGVQGHDQGSELDAADDAVTAIEDFGTERVCADFAAVVRTVDVGQWARWGGGGVAGCWLDTPNNAPAGVASGV